MGITIDKILAKEGSYAVAELRHGKTNLVAKVWDEENVLKDQIGKDNLIVELNFDQLLAVKLLENFDDVDASIIPTNNSFILKGRICQILAIENDVLIDIYLQRGLEFISILESECEGLELKEQHGIEIEVIDLTFYPVYN